MTRGVGWEGEGARSRHARGGLVAAQAQGRARCAAATRMHTAAAAAACTLRGALVLCSVFDMMRARWAGLGGLGGP